MLLYHTCSVPLTEEQGGPPVDVPASSAAAALSSSYFCGWTWALHACMSPMHWSVLEAAREKEVVRNSHKVGVHLHGESRRKKMRRKSGPDAAG